MFYDVELLVKSRLQRNETLEHAALGIGISPSYLHKIENETQECKLCVLRQMILYYNLDPSLFFMKTQSFKTHRQKIEANILDRLPVEDLSDLFQKNRTETKDRVIEDYQTVIAMQNSDDENAIRSLLVKIYPKVDLHDFSNIGYSFIEILLATRLILFRTDEYFSRLEDFLNRLLKYDQHLFYLLLFLDYFLEYCEKFNYKDYIYVLQRIKEAALSQYYRQFKNISFLDK